jgi:hypothetical protein
LILVYSQEIEDPGRYWMHNPYQRIIYYSGLSTLTGARGYMWKLVMEIYLLIYDL